MNKNYKDRFSYEYHIYNDKDLNHIQHRINNINKNFVPRKIKNVQKPIFKYTSTISGLKTSKATKTFDLENRMWPSNKALHKIQKTIHNRYTILNKLLPVESRYIKYISKFDWTFINQESLGLTKMKNRLKMDGRTLNNLFSNILINNNYRLLNKNLNILVKNLDKGHSIQIVKMKRILNKNMNDYSLFFNLLFSMLEYLFEIKNSKFPKKTLNQGKADKYIKNVKKRNRIQHNLLPLLIVNELNVVSNLYTPYKFSKYSYNKMPYNRNSVQHGVFDPNNFKYTDFLKLVILCANLSMNSDVKYK